MHKFIAQMIYTRQMPYQVLRMLIKVLLHFRMIVQMRLHFAYSVF